MKDQDQGGKADQAKSGKETCSPSPRLVIVASRLVRQLLMMPPRHEKFRAHLLPSDNPARAENEIDTTHLGAALHDSTRPKRVLRATRDGRRTADRMRALARSLRAALARLYLAELDELSWSGLERAPVCLPRTWPGKPAGRASEGSCLSCREAP
jgi:hypothetical protein